jgi:hypothetical protein
MRSSSSRNLSGLYPVTCRKVLVPTLTMAEATASSICSSVMALSLNSLNRPHRRPQVCHEKRSPVFTSNQRTNCGLRHGHRHLLASMVATLMRPPVTATAGELCPVPDAYSKLTLSPCIDCSPALFRKLVMLAPHPSGFQIKWEGRGEEEPWPSGNLPGDVIFKYYGGGPLSGTSDGVASRNFVSAPLLAPE